MADHASPIPRPDEESGPDIPPCMYQGCADPPLFIVRPDVPGAPAVTACGDHLQVTVFAMVDRDAIAVVPIADLGPCSECGCTSDRACPTGCYWIAAELCSRCGEVEAARPVLYDGHGRRVS